MKNYLKNELKHLPMMLLICVMFYGITTLATNYVFDSSDVRFDNTGTEIQAGDVQGAIDETFRHLTDYNNMDTRVTNVENNKSDKSSTVSTVNWDTNNKKLTKTINGNTTDVVTAATIQSSLSNMTAATSSSAGTSGLVPAPAAGKQASFLRGDGTWVVPTDTNTWPTKSDLGLGNVENKSSATIRGELTKSNVTTALGYTPPTSDTNTWRGIQNNLTSTSTSDSLSANMGKTLNDRINFMGYNTAYLKSKTSGSNYVMLRSINNTLEITAFLGNDNSYLSLALATGGLSAYYVVNGTTNKSKSIFTW